MTTRHSIDRLKTRIDALQLAQSEYLHLTARALRAARASEEHDLAAMIMQLDHSHKVVTADGQVSKGDQVWAVCRHGDLITVFLRNSTQPISAAKLNVDRLVTVK